MKTIAVGYISSTYLMAVLINSQMELLFNFFTIFAPIAISLYHVSKLRQDVVNKDHRGSWKDFAKSWFNKKFKNKKDED